MNAIDIRCPKCGGAIEVPSELAADPVLCVRCGHEFSVRQERPLGFSAMGRMGPGRAEMEGVGKAKVGGAGGFAVLMVLIVLIAIVVGFVNFWVAVAVGVVGLLAGILLQLARLNGR